MTEWLSPLLASIAPLTIIASIKYLKLIITSLRALVREVHTNTSMMKAHLEYHERQH